MHDLPLITTIAVGFSAAWLLGLLTQKIGLSPIVGYLLAGVVIGPHTPGYAGDIEIAHQLAEVGVILLMFGVGLHFHLADLLAVKYVAIPGAVGQSLVATVLGLIVFTAIEPEMSTISGVVLGMAMAVASTVVLMRVLIDANVLNSSEGHVSVGWLLVEDVFTVIFLVLIPVLGAANDPAQAEAASFTGLASALAIALLKLAVMVALLMWGGARIIPWILVQVARLRSRELFTLTVLVFSISIAAGAYELFGASMALGAFLAGMVVALSPVSHQAAADALPMRDAFAVIFFVSVGMLFDPAFLLEEPLMVIAALAIILIVKPLAALVIVATLGYSLRTALTVALALAQIGEFSFILADLARKYGLMPDSGHNALVASAIISITLNPLIFRTLPRIEAWITRHPWLFRLLNGRAQRRASSSNLATQERIQNDHGAGKRHAIVVGYGPVGRSVHRLLTDAGLTSVIIDMNMDTVSSLNASGESAIYGDASHESILEQAGMRSASHLVLTLPQTAARVAIVTAARHLNPHARILVRAHYLREREQLEQAGATGAVFEEGEAAIALARLVLADTGANRDTVEQKVRDLRLQLIQENMSNIRSRRIRSIMVPWTRVRRLGVTTPRQEVLHQVAEQRFSRWPITEPRSGKVTGYLLAKDLIAVASEDGDWTTLVRPIRAVPSDADIESTLMQMQSEGTTIAVVEDAGSPVGLITLEDILEQVVGRIEDEYPHEPQLSLYDSIKAGKIILELQGRQPDQVILEMASSIPASSLPPDAHIADLALTREREVSTDLGVGVAIPHARCPGLTSALVVFGRSSSGIAFSSESAQPVHLVFLLVTPMDQPDLQLNLLAQLARIAGNPAARESLRKASSEREILTIISEAAAAT